MKHLRTQLGAELGPGEEWRGAEWLAGSCPFRRRAVWTGCVRFAQRPARGTSVCVEAVRQPDDGKDKG